MLGCCLPLHIANGTPPHDHRAEELRMAQGMFVAVFASLMCLLVGTLSTVGCRIAATGKLGMNTRVGIRVPAVFASDAAWRSGHHRAYLFSVASTSVSMMLVGVTVFGTNHVPPSAVMCTSSVGFLTWVAGVTLCASTGAKEHKTENEHR